MTNSFTSMALAAALITSLLSQSHRAIEEQISKMVDYGTKLFEKHLSTLQKVSQINFSRIIFLGSGPLLGIARESHLKVQELCDGEVIGKFDSFLGFRHGPKVII